MEFLVDKKSCFGVSFLFGFLLVYLREGRSFFLFFYILFVMDVDVDVDVDVDDVDVDLDFGFGCGHKLMWMLV